MRRTNDEQGGGAEVEAGEGGASTAGRLVNNLLRTAGFGLLLAAILGYLALNVVAISNRERAERAKSTCSLNTGLLARAMQVYVSDYDALPLAERWGDLLLPYVEDRTRFVCPAARNQSCSYAMNTAASGLRDADQAGPYAFVVLFESDAGWNAHGRAQLLPPSPRHGPGDFVVLLAGDGQLLHTLWAVREQRKVDHREAWEKRYSDPIRFDLNAGSAASGPRGE